MNKQFMADILGNFSNVRVLCVGDIMLDRFVYGRVERISPEGPIPVLKIERENMMLGGVGNVVANLASLKAKVHLVSVVGQDSAGDTVRAKLQDIVASSNDIVISTKRPTTVKTRFLASNQQLLRTDLEETMALSRELQEKIIENVRDVIERVNIVVLSDYGKGVLTPDVISAIIDMAKEHGKDVIVDPKGKDYRCYRGASVVTPNRHELAEATGVATVTDDDIVGASFKLIKDCGIKSVLATRSQDGISVVTAEGKPTHIPTIAKEVYDVSGAGDTVVAVTAVTLGSGANLEQAGYLANLAGGVVVGKIGTSIISPDEMMSSLEKQEMGDVANENSLKKEVAPHLSLTQIIELAEKWRAQGLSVGFTNGCFDLFHPGHVSLLVQSAQQCDKLIVAINSDRSVRQLKGETRPIHNENSRSVVLGAMGMVDAIIVFDEETPMKQIQAVNPDVLIKGADYTIETVVGAEHVMSYGGRVFLAELKDGFSTTNIVTKLAV